MSLSFLLLWTGAALLSADGVFLEIPIGAPAASVSSVRAVDLDGDGDFDAAYTSTFQMSELGWLRNQGGSPPVFVKQVIHSVNAGIRTLDVGDLDGDGDLDGASTFAQSPTHDAAWYENRGGSPPSFTRRVLATFSEPPGNIVIADLDGDGDRDIASHAMTGTGLGWYDNQGGSPPTFVARSFSSGMAFDQLAAADIDLDGDIDLAAGSFGETRLRWYDNNGAKPAVFTERVISADLGYSPSDVKVADITGDGRPDIISVGQFGERPRVVLEVGSSGSPAAFTERLIAEHPGTALVAADLDHDGDLDVLVTSGNDQEIAWYENLGGKQPIFNRSVIVSGLVGAQGIDAADIDKDGAVDVLAASFSSKLAWYRNLLALLPVFNRRTLASFPSLPDAMAAALPGDTLVAAPESFDTHFFESPTRSLALESTARVYQPTGLLWEITDGTSIETSSGEAVDLGSRFHLKAIRRCELSGDVFIAERSAQLPLDAGSELLVQADGGAFLNGEVTLGANSTLSFSRELKLGAPFLPAAFQEQFAAFVNQASTVAAADLDGDGDLDFVGAGSNEILWSENRPGESFPFLQRTIVAGLGATRAVQVGDVNGDKRMDFVAALFDSDTVAWFENQGGSPPTFTQRVITSTADGASAVALGDLDGDKDLDVVVASANDDTIALFINRGGSPPVFVKSVLSATAHGVSFVAAADLNGDGVLDILAVYPDDNSVAWFRSTGRLQYEESVIVSNAKGAISATVADIEGDGDLDVISAATPLGGISWYENDGGAKPTFPERRISSGVTPSPFAAADLDSDGDADIVAGYPTQERVDWLENQGGAPIQFFARRAGQREFAVDGSMDFAIADMNADGRVDILAAAKTGFSIVLLKNISDDPGTTTIGPQAVLDAITIESEGHHIVLHGGTLSAFTIANGGDLQGFGILQGDVTNAGQATFLADTEVVGKYYNSGSTVVQNGTLSILGTLTNTGSITGNAVGLGGGGGGAAVDLGVFVEGSLVVDAAAELRLPVEGSSFALGGDFDVAIDNHDRFDMAKAELRLAGLDGAAQTIEALSADTGLDLSGLDHTLPGHFPIGVLRIGPGALTAQVVDHRDNDGQGQTVCEALYVGTLRIDAGATLENPSCKVYYRDLELHGMVTNPENLVRLVDCPSCSKPFRRGDVNGDAEVDIVDAVRLLFDLFVSARPEACARAGDIDDSGSLNVTDPVALLEYLFHSGAPPKGPFPDCGSDPTPDSLGCVGQTGCP